jgi:hypothetical protein
MDLFSALAYEGIENRNSVLLLSVLDHLSDETCAAFLRVVTEAELGSQREIRAQYSAGDRVLDGWLRWPGRCAIVMEAKVDDPLGRAQPERYAAWLAETHDEPARVLWLVTRDRPEVRELHPTLKVPAGVTVVWTSWTMLADRAHQFAQEASATETDRLLLTALTRRLRGAGLASTPQPAIDVEALALAVGLAPHVSRLKGQMVSWLRGLPWLAGWTRESRDADWIALSVYAERTLTLAQRDAAGRKRKVSWWVEVNAPIEHANVWPRDQRYGVRLRVGVHLTSTAVREIALEPLRACLGAPAASARAQYMAASEYAPWTFDHGTYHEVFWLVYLDPADLPASAERLRLAMEEQARRMAPLFDGGLATIACAQ